MPDWFTSLLHLAALPEYGFLGLLTVFAVATLSATLLPLGSEAFVLGFVQLRPDLLWPTLLAATLGNTLGGCISWWMGAVARKAHKARMAHKTLKAHKADEASHDPSPAFVQSAWMQKAQLWLHQHGAAACLLSWLPLVGDPLCLVAGWIGLPFWPCTAYMAVGKFGRYLFLTEAMRWLF